MLNPEKIRIVLNKMVNLKSVNEKNHYWRNCILQ